MVKQALGNIKTGYLIRADSLKFYKTLINMVAPKMASQHILQIVDVNRLAISDNLMPTTTIKLVNLIAYPLLTI